MSREIFVLGEALMDCVAQPDGSLRPLMGGSPFNLARAAALRGATVSYLNPLSTDRFGAQLWEQLHADRVRTLLPPTSAPTSLAVVQVHEGQPSYGFYREGIADRDYRVDQVLAQLAEARAGVLHTGSLLLVPPEHEKVLAVLHGAKAMGWTISVDVNLRPQLAADLRPQLAADLAGYVRAVREVLALADWLKASDEDVQTLGYAAHDLGHAGEIAGTFLAQGIRRLALTFGAQGAWLGVDGQVAQAVAPRVHVVDTVGAGDTFWGNCLADWALQDDGADARVAKTLHEAMLAAAINCTRAGCQPPGYDEVKRMAASGA